MKIVLIVFYLVSSTFSTNLVNNPPCSTGCIKLKCSTTTKAYLNRIYSSSPITITILTLFYESQQHFFLSSREKFFFFFHVNNISKRSLNVCSTAYQSSLSTDASESDETARKLVLRLSTRGEVLYPSNSASSHIEQGSSIPRKVQLWKSHNSPQTNLFNHFGVQNPEQNVFKNYLLRGT